MNPIPYHADYFGHKLHLDQNEKLAMFGVTHVMAIDGYSNKIVGWASMPFKNNCIIYDEVFRFVARYTALTSIKAKILRLYIDYY